VALDQLPREWSRGAKAKGVAVAMELLVPIEDGHHGSVIVMVVAGQRALNVTAAG
jgi:hypothetical protein